MLKVFLKLELVLAKNLCSQDSCNLLAHSSLRAIFIVELALSYVEELAWVLVRI
jgi:hypothetical protein